MGKGQSRTVKNAIICSILSFVLMLCLLGIAIIAVGKYSMFSVHGIMHCCDRIEYYEDINDEMTDIAREKGIPYGINSFVSIDDTTDETTVEEGIEETTSDITAEDIEETENEYVEIFDDERIRSDMENTLIAQLDGKTYLVDTEYIRDNILANVTADLGELEETQMESLESYITEIRNMYADKMEIEGSKYFVPLINLWNKIVIIGIPICILIGTICGFLLISIRSKAYKGLRYVAYSVLGTGGILTLVFSASISDGFIYKFNISDVYMRKFYTYWIGHEMLMQVFTGIGFLLVGAVLVYVIYRQKYKYR